MKVTYHQFLLGLNLLTIREWMLCVCMKKAFGEIFHQEHGVFLISNAYQGIVQKITYALENLKGMNAKRILNVILGYSVKLYEIQV